MCLVRHAQIIQNKKLAISLHYLKIEVNDKVDFMHEGKHDNLLQIDIMILMEMVKYFQTSPKASLQCLYNISKKTLKMKFIFCMQINIKVAYKLISIFWSVNLPTR